ncbi:hypothetical protein [Nocardia alba]|uniref:Low molecular weight antigen MTB12-like C-terminal domain-containing protein n=1 Tax=Nocardia alba TaxID=225051 RepID=A0A4R1G026_9NOCA|nr:hypothetical protein [Nocardia alba]TCJ99419.1 hypothetical protein DFR71_0394 [Nocardia alba]
MSRRHLAGRTLTAAALLVTLPISASCAADEDTGAKPTAVVAHEISAPPPLPSADEVGRLLYWLLDASVPNAEKLELIQGIGSDPELPNRVADAPRQSGTTVTITITGTRTAPPGMLAEGTAAVDNSPPQPIIVNFVAEDGKWKVEKAWYCQIAFSFMVASPACPT